MATFTYPFIITGTATIEGDIADEARLTVERDLRAEWEADPTDLTHKTDNGVTLAIGGFEVGSLAAEAPAMLVAMRDALSASDANDGGSLMNAVAAFRPIIDRILYALPLQTVEG